MTYPHLNYERNLWQKEINLIAGIDEAGRGAWAGPLVSAAVIFSPESEIPEGINDSKKLSPRKREKLAPQIITKAIAVGIGIVPATKIDQYGISWATQLSFALALNDLNQKPHYLLTDAFPCQEFSPEKQLNLCKGDTLSITIASASIIAKTYRDWLMSRIYDSQFPQYKFAQHKGYGTALHREKILKNQPCLIHRKTFLKKLLSDQY